MKLHLSMTAAVLLALGAAAPAQNTNPPASPATPPADIAKPKLGSVPAKSAFEGELAKLTRNPWTWETKMGKSNIKFYKDGMCVHSNFNGTFEFQTADTVIVHMATRPEVLKFNFGKREFTGFDPVLKQNIIGRQTYQK